MAFVLVPVAGAPTVPHASPFRNFQAAKRQSYIGASVRKRTRSSAFPASRSRLAMTMQSEESVSSLSQSPVGQEIIESIPEEVEVEVSSSIKDSEVLQGVSATAQAVLEDLAARPEYYLNVTGVVLGLCLSVIVLSSTLFALESIPLLPDSLRVIGLAYIFWFLRKYLFSAAERSNLQAEIDEFVAGVRDSPPPISELEQES